MDYESYFTVNKRDSYLRKFLYIFLVGFVAGIVFANFAWRVRPQSVDLLSIELLKNFDLKGITPPSLFLYLLTKRLEGFLLYSLLGITILGVPFVWGGLLWYGFLTGALCSMFLLQLGVKGVLVGSGVILPQILIYAPVMIFLYYEVYRMSEYGWNKTLGLRGKYQQYFLRVALLLMVYLCGIVLEAYLNPVVLKFITGKFLQ